MDKKLISIIVAVYNIEQYLPKCIESIIEQTYDNLEIILVDDGSTDDSPQICDAYARGDQRIQVIHKKNGGLSDARNAGLEVAKGNYIGFVDGDDWIEKEMYQHMLDACERNRAQVAVCRYRQITQSGIIDDSAGNSVLLTRKEALEIYVCTDPRYLIYNSVWSKLFLADLIKDMRFPVGKNAEDIMFTTKAFCRMERCAYLDNAYYNYVLDRQGSIMNEKAGERRLKDEIPFWREQIAFFKENGMEELSDKAAYHFYRRLLFYYIDFMGQKSMGVYSKKVVQQIRNDRAIIWKLYQNPYVAKGDRARMGLMLVMPIAYYQCVKWYDRVIIPLRNRKQSGQE